MQETKKNSSKRSEASNQKPETTTYEPNFSSYKLEGRRPESKPQARNQKTKNWIVENRRRMPETKTYIQESKDGNWKPEVRGKKQEF